MISENDVSDAPDVRDTSTWPSIRDVVMHLRISSTRVRQLMRSGAFDAKRTRVGWLVNPESVAAWEAQRAARLAVGRR
jgi:hypothetical protein